MLTNIVLGLVIAVFVYMLIRLGSNYIINNYYITADRQQQRREEYIENLQSFADTWKLSSEDTDKIAAWSREHPYVYLLIYKDNQLFFTSDMDSNSNADDSNNGVNAGNNGTQTESGVGVTPSLGDLGFTGIEEAKQNREDLIAEAEANGLHQIELSDGTLLAAVTEFTQELYYDITNVTALIMAVIALVVVLINYMRRVIAKIKRLESDVTIVSHIDMNHRIVCEGDDEISRLSRNVETMRNSILLNLEREREAREANTELVTSISHDIRTPLTVLLGYIDMMKSRAEEDELMKSYVAASEKTAMRLKQLSDDMFKYALAFGDTGKGIILEEYDAPTLIEQLLAEHIVLLSESGYEVKMSGSEDIIEDGATILTDAQNLMRIVDNVFSNLYKYADKSEPVEICAKRERARVIFTCKNKVLADASGAESNGIGLKTCIRLAEFIAEDFTYKKDGEYFTVMLVLKIIPPKSKQ